MFTHERVTYELNVSNINPETPETACEASPSRDTSSITFGKSRSFLHTSVWVRVSG